LSKIISIATGVPEFKHQQDDIFLFADNIHSNNETDSRKLKFLYHQSGIKTRYSVIPDYNLLMDEWLFYPRTKNLEPFPDLEKRMQWYDKNAGTLSAETILKCINGKIAADEITHLITVSCTGMSAPGIDLEIMETLNLPGNIFRTSINFMGCYAAIHALKIADALCIADPKANVVIVCTELCTLHFQKENSIDNITSTLLFADGCAAVLVQHSQTEMKGLFLKSFYSDVSFRGKKDMSWQLSSKGFLMTLSGYVPDLVREDFNQLVEKALGKALLHKEDINYWCIHPGGKKILQCIMQSLQLKADGLSFSYDILKDYGNMSSPTILFVLQKILEDIESKNTNERQTVFGAAFGPGLTMETFTAVYD
jgi:predicted naringenin-chalcone synthase